MRRLLIGIACLATACAAHAQVAPDSETAPPVLEYEEQEVIRQAVASSSRTISSIMRDAHRNPAQTLSFFALAPDQTVVEIWPGAGWYTEILAPLLREDGKLIAAHFDPEGGPDYFAKSRSDYERKLQNRANVYDRVEMATLNYDPEQPIAAANSADRVVTFRNVHNWLADGMDETKVVFAKMYAVLKPGGMLGLVEHRARPGTSLEEMVKTGYVDEPLIVDLAVEAGFELVSRSPVNQNPQDLADHPHGVWSLPPTLRGGTEDRARYMGIGESDRMTLLFVKPE
ncbi:class I SAM-dependent methyltransferase [Halopseudomonas laoshanensis]|uniref:class I SAM-dependent methyltransferase n=1 Tax=Halopseudomonas laoshanensis TaxID=2268758 RepID=UPI003735D3E4